MIRWFKSDSPFIALLLLIYAIVIKGYNVVHPLPINHPESGGGGYLYHVLHTWKHGQFLVNSHGQGLAFFLLFLDSLLLNVLTNKFRLFQQGNYLTAFSFLVLSSFLPEWNQMSPSLFASPFIAWALLLCFNLYGSRSPKGQVFNIGLLIGVASLFFVPAMLLILLIWITLLVSRPFRLAEWMLAVLGVLAPYYFLGTYFFISNQWNFGVLFPGMKWILPHWLNGYSIMVSLGIVAVLSLIGLVKLQQSYMKLLIQVRKHWSIVLLFIPVALFISFLGGTSDSSMLVIALLPTAILTAFAFHSINKKWISSIISILILLYILGSQFNLIPVY